MVSGRTKNATLNVFFNLSNQILSLLLSFLSRTVFVRYLGVEYLGINGLFSDVLGLLSMADLGFGTAMVFSFYKPLAENNYRKMAALTSFYKKIYMGIATFVAIVGLSVTPFLHHIIKTEQVIPNITIYYLVSLANVVFSYLCVYRTSVLTADQKGYKITRITMIVNIVRSVIQIVGIIVFHSYLVYLVVGCLSVLLTNIFATHIANRDYPFIAEKVDLNSEERKDIFQNIFSGFLYKVSSVLLTTTDNLIISILVGTAAVGYYSNYLLLQSKITMFYSLVFTSVTASIGNLIAKEAEKKRYEIFKCEQVISFIVCGIVVPCYIVLVNDLISIWLGKEYILSQSVVIAIGVNMYLSCVLQPLWSYREATGLYKRTKWVMFICAIENIVLSIVLGRLKGIEGILFASSISRLSTYVWYEPKILFMDFFKQKVNKYYTDLLKNFLLITVITIILLAIDYKFLPKNLFEWILKAFMNTIIAITIIGFIYYRKTELTIVRKRVYAIFLKHR